MERTMDKKSEDKSDCFKALNCLKTRHLTSLGEVISVK